MTPLPPGDFSVMQQGISALLGQKPEEAFWMGGQNSRLV